MNTEFKYYQLQYYLIIDNKTHEWFEKFHDKVQGAVSQNRSKQQEGLETS